MIEVTRQDTRKPRYAVEMPAPSYAQACLPDAAQMAALKEKLRYHTYVRAGTLARFMQALGDIGRAYFPWMAKVIRRY